MPSRKIRKPTRTAAAPVETSSAGAAGRRLYWLAAGAALLVLGFRSFFPVQSDDIFMYLAIGRRFFRDGGFPTIDPFLYSIPNYHWYILHEWASHLLAYGLFQLGGWTMLIIAKTTMILATAGIPLALAHRLTLRSPFIPLLLILSGIAASHRLIERSSLFSDFFTAAILAILLIERATPGRWRYLIPLIFLAWFNVHPGIYPALAICGLAVLWDLPRLRERNVRGLMFCIAAGVAALLANPHGIYGVIYPLRPLFDPSWEVYKERNYEWMPTAKYADGDMAYMLKAYYFIIAICIALAAVSLARRPWFELCVLVLFIWLGRSAVRFLPMASFGLTVLAVGFGAKCRFLLDDERLRGIRLLARAMNACVALGAAAYCVYMAVAGNGPLQRHLGVGLDHHLHPEAAAEFVDKIDLKTNLFNQHEFGSYLAWRWDGRRKLFYHGFVDDLDFYAKNYIAINENVEQFDRIVKQFNIGAFMLRRMDITPDLPLYYTLYTRRADWTLVFVDERAMIFIRNTPQNRAALDQCTPLN